MLCPGRLAFVVVLVLLVADMAGAGVISPERRTLYEGLKSRFRKAPAPAGPVGTYVVGKMVSGELGHFVGTRGERTWNDDVLEYLRRQGPVALDVLGDVADNLEKQLRGAEPGGTAGFKQQMVEAYAAWQADKARIAGEAEAVRGDESLSESERAQRLRELSTTEETRYKINSAAYGRAKALNDRAKTYFSILYGDLAIVTALGGKLFSLQRAAELAELPALADFPVLADLPSSPASAAGALPGVPSNPSKREGTVCWLQAGAREARMVAIRLHQSQIPSKATGHRGLLAEVAVTLNRSQIDAVTELLGLRRRWTTATVRGSLKTDGSGRFLLRAAGDFERAPDGPSLVLGSSLVADEMLEPTDRLDPNRPVVLPPVVKPVSIHRRR